MVSDGGLDLEAIKARVEAATEGPWDWGPLDMTPAGKLALRGPGMQPVVKAASADVWPSATDAAFIAAARSDVPALVAEVERLNQEIVRLRAGHADLAAMQAEAVRDGICGDEAPTLNVPAGIRPVCVLRIGHRSEWHEAPNFTGAPMRWHHAEHAAVDALPKLVAPEATVDDMITRLRAALDEDERVALAAVHYASGATWTLRDDSGQGLSGWLYSETDSLLDDPPGDEVGHHIARHDPARVLRWVKAAREILDRHAPLPDVRPGGGLLRCAEFDRLVGGEYAQDWPCPEVLAIASVYGDGDG